MSGFWAFIVTAITLFLIWVVVHLVIDLIQDRRLERMKEDQGRERRARMRDWSERR